MKQLITWMDIPKSRFLFQEKKEVVSESDTIKSDPESTHQIDEATDFINDLEMSEPLDKKGIAEFKSTAYDTHVNLIWLDLDHLGIKEGDIVQIFEPVKPGAKSWNLKVGGYSDFIVMDEKGNPRFGFKKFEEGEISDEEVFADNGVQSKEFGKCMIYRDGKWEESENLTEQDLKDLKSVKDAARLYFDITTNTGKAPERRDERKKEEGLEIKIKND